MSETTIFAVSGDPVLHSRSPQIFNKIFGERNLDAAYVRLSAESAEEAAATAKSMNLQGFNATSPFKSFLMPHLDELDPQALAVDAVNCVVKRDNLWKGYNTDIFGAVRAIEAGGVGLKNKRVVILGAGGAARAAVSGMIKSGASDVVLMNRTPKKAEAVSRRLGCAWAPMERIAEIVGRSDILISCLSSAQSPIDRDVLRKGLVVMDANYRNSRLAQSALDRGCTVVNGLEWLFYQALLSFRLFTGLEISPALQDDVKAALYQADVLSKPNLALIGFMGSGKTTIGKRLAEKAGFDFVDTDTVIEHSLGLTVAEIFKTRGEDYFRKQEKSLLETSLPSSKKTVFSLGGGSVLDESNRALIGQYCRTVWLWISPLTALKRIERFSRPLLEDDVDGRKAEAILKSRLSLYAKLSDMVLSSEAGTPEERARRIHREHEMD